MNPSKSMYFLVDKIYQSFAANWTSSRMNKRIIISSIVLAVSIVSVGSVAAQTRPTPPKGITVSPAFQKISIPADQAELPLEFKVTNNRATAQTIMLSTADFNSLDETGGLFFVGARPTTQQKKYGLSEWLSLPQTKVTIRSAQTVTIKAAISNRQNLSAGGHYGALMLTLDQGTDNVGQPNRVALQPIASSLIFLSKRGGEVYKLNLTEVSENHSLFKLPDKVSLRFKNEGNTHVVPRGIISLTDSNGKLVRKGIINEASAIVLPETARRFEIPLLNINLANKPGNYKLTVDYRFDGYDGFKKYQKSILLLTPLGLVIGVFSLLAVLLGFYYLRKNKLLKSSFLHLKNRIKK